MPGPIRSSGPEPFRGLAARLQPKPRRPVMTEPEVVRVDDPGVIVPPQLEPQLPDLTDQFWTPTGTP